jgi:DNA-directed RNA polymerase I subunit RPA34.5
MSNNRKRKIAAPNSAHQEPLDPPTFQLPIASADDNNRYELWSVRLPASVNLQDLQGYSFELNDAASAAAAVKSENFESNGEKYTLQSGHAVENETFRLLLRKTNDDDDDDSSDDDDDDDDMLGKKIMTPCPRPFQRHFNVVRAIEGVSDMELAPRQMASSADPMPMRHAYEPVSQKTGMKRRWTPPGAAGAPSTRTSLPTTKMPRTESQADPPASPNHRTENQEVPPKDNKSSKKLIKLKEEDDDEAPSNRNVGKDSDDSERKERKKAKKAAKKAKEAKRPKKVKKEES